MVAAAAAVVKIFVFFLQGITSWAHSMLGGNLGGNISLKIIKQNPSPSFHENPEKIGSMKAREFASHRPAHPTQPNPTTKTKTNKRSAVQASKHLLHNILHLLVPVHVHLIPTLLVPLQQPIDLPPPLTVPLAKIAKVVRFLRLALQPVEVALVRA